MNRIKILWAYKAGGLQHRLDMLLSQRWDLITPTPKTEEDLKTFISDADVLLVRRLPFGRFVSRSVIEYGQNLKLIQKLGNNLETIDVATATRAGIPVATMPMVIDVSVAEHTFLLMLALSKKLLTAHRETVKGGYKTLGITPITTTQDRIFENWMKLTELKSLYQKTLGIIGIGEIGKEVAKRAHCFGMNILYYDLRRLSDAEEKSLHIKHSTLSSLLEKSDYVSIHLQHTEQTEKMFGQEQFSRMKKNAFLINTSRGGIVDHKALFQALEKRQIAGAGIDVFEKEPIPIDSQLLNLKNVILTPHIAGCADMNEQTKNFDAILNNISRVANGKKPLNIANPNFKINNEKGR